jgi:acetolactate synthase I/II/III large subunit
VGNSSPPKSDGRAIDVFLRYLKAEGATTVFGIPGALLHPFFAAIEGDREIRLVVAKHEEGAAFMADGYARVGKKIAVCAATGGPGATNLLTGVGCAFADGVPMLVLTGQVARDAQGKGASQDTNREDIDIVEMFRPVTKYSAMVSSPGTLTHHLRRALRFALTGRPGPVHLCVPIDIWHKPLTEDWFRPETYRPTTLSFDRNEVQKAAGMLVDATRPVILAGSGVRIAGAEDHLRALAELLPARVATSPRAKGVFPEDHRLSLGVMGFAGHRHARETILGSDVDVLLCVGASLNEATTLNWQPALRPSRALLQCDIDSDRIGRNYPVDVSLVGDAQTIVVELVYHLHRLLREGQQPASRWPEAPPLTRGHDRYDRAQLRLSEQVPLTPERWRVELQEAIPSNAVVISDIGGHMLNNIHDLCIQEGQLFIINLGFLSMGHGTCAPIGAALARPDRPMIAIVGDACFTMNGMEILTAAEYGIPVVWIVENNQMHGITYHGSVKVGGTPLDSVRYKKPLEVAAISRAMGVASWIVDTPGRIQQALREALATRAPALIEVRVDAAISPPLEDRALAIAGFTHD